MATADEARLRRALALATGASSDFDLNPGVVLPEGRVLRPAAVLIAAWARPDGVQVILTKRASHLQHHPGQVAFPGGKVEPGDTGPEAAALREAQEEIALPPDRVRILGALPAHETVTGFSVIPFLAMVEGDFTPRPEAGEVEEVFTVPLAHLALRSNYRIERRRWRGEWRRYHVVPWGPHYIWGATARILRGLAEGLAE